MGNRGILHNEDQQLITQKWRHKTWVTCALRHTDKKGQSWHRKIMQPGNYTELFFLDEATALSAGHRPCALCRRENYNKFRQALGDHYSSAKALDEILHAERTRLIEQKSSTTPPYPKYALKDLPDGVIILRSSLLENDLSNAPDPPIDWFKNGPWLKNGGFLMGWTHNGYQNRIHATDEYVRVLTPETIIKALKGGYKPVIHPSGTPHPRSQNHQ